MSRLRARLRVARIKRTVLKMSELKIKSGTLGENQLYHDVPGDFGNIFQTAHMPSQGDGEDQRIGNKIYISGMKIKLMFLQKADRPNVTFKIWILKVPINHVYAYNTTFDNVSGNMLLDDIDNNRVFKVVYQKTIKRGPTATDGTVGKEWTFPWKIWVPLKRQMQFQADNGQNENTAYQYRMLIGAYDSSGSLVTDNIASVTEYHRLYFRDF